jgi:hypothetical protein
MSHAEQVEFVAAGPQEIGLCGRSPPRHLGPCAAAPPPVSVRAQPGVRRQGVRSAKSGSRRNPLQRLSPEL